MRRENRLTRRGDFQAVYRRGKTWVHPLLVLKGLPNSLGVTRCGFAVGKLIGKAVARNLVRRRFREGVRQTSARPGWDLVIVARGLAGGADYHRLKAALSSLLRQANLLGRDAG